MLPNTKGCLGLGVSRWNWFYFPQGADENGYEWVVRFRTPVFVNNRCFKNNKVAIGSGGFHNGCEGSGWA